MIEKAGIPEVNQAVNFIYKMSEDEKIREMAETREAYLRDQRSAFTYYEERGIEKGRLEGIEEAIETMRKAGASESLIQATIDLMRNGN